MLTVYSDEPADEGLYKVRIVASQDDGYGVLLRDFTEFVLDVKFERLEAYTVQLRPTFVDLELYQFSWTFDVLDTTADVSIELP